MILKKWLRLIHLIILLLVQPQPGQAAADKSTVYDYDGNVVLVRRGTGLTMKSDLSIRPNDVLKTDSDGTVSITMNQLVGIHFANTAECLFEDIKTSSMHLTMSSGQALINLRTMPSGGVFTFETPNAIISANLLAQLFCRIEGENERLITRVGVRKGSVRVRIKKSGAEISVLENQALDIQQDTFIPPPRPSTPDETKLLFRVNSVIIGSEDPS